METVQRNIMRAAGAVAAFIVLLAALLLSGTYTAYGAQTGTLNVEGVRDGDTVKAYLVAKRNPYGVEFTRDFGISMDDYLKAGDDTAAMKGYANTMFAKVANTEAQASAVSDGGTVKLSGLEHGSYLLSVVPAAPGCGRVYQATVVNLESSSADAVLKSEPITITKTVNGAHETDEYAVGSRVPFTLTTHVPSYPDNATRKTFRIVDEHDAGLSFGAGDVSVKCGDAELAEGDAYAYSESSSEGKTTHTLEFDYAKVAQYAGQEITVSISALVTEAAVPAKADVNTAKVVFRNNPFEDGGDDEDTDEAKVRTYGVYLYKVVKGTDEPLAGAKFELLVEDENGDVEITEDDVTKKMRVVASMESGEDGYASVKGLADGVYYLRETEAPEGYALTNKMVEVTVNEKTVAEEGDWAGYVFGAKVENSEDDTTIDNPPTPTTHTNPPNPTPSDDDDDDDEDTVTVDDDDTPKSGWTPKTGDIVLGGLGLLAIAGAVGGVSALRKRKDDEK